MSRVYEDRVKEILANSSDDGKVKSRESTSLEFKENFVVKPFQQALVDSSRMELYLRFLDEAPSEHL